LWKKNDNRNWFDHRWLSTINVNHSIWKSILMMENIRLREWFTIRFMNGSDVNYCIVLTMSTRKNCGKSNAIVLVLSEVAFSVMKHRSVDYNKKLHSFFFYINNRLELQKREILYLNKHSFLLQLCSNYDNNSAHKVQCFIIPSQC
jgi:hypothetical protein